MDAKSLRKNNLKQLRGKATVIHHKTHHFWVTSKCSAAVALQLLCSCLAVISLQQLRAKAIARQYYIERTEPVLHGAEYTGSASVPATILATI
jgi:hypothetical protein